MSDRGRTIRLATRGSDLALRQAGAVKEALEGRRVSVELVEVQTRGDEIRDELIHRLGTTGAFVRALDEEVLDGSVDAAVHSMKDVPTDQPPDLVVAGVPERAPAGDVLVTPDGAAPEDLPEGATVGTASLRRRAQLLADRPDLSVEPLRGNVDTRVEKLLAPHLQREHERRLAAEAADDDDREGGTEDDERKGGTEDDEREGGAEDDETGGGDGSGAGAEVVTGFERPVEDWVDDLAEIERRALGRDVDATFAAIVLAAAGLERIGLLDRLDVHHFEPTAMVPSPGQGALAVTARADGDAAELCNDVLDHPPTRVATTVERTILGELGGGCVAPVGIHARLRGEVVATAVRVLSQDGTEEVRATRELPVEAHPAAAVEFAADLADRGAAALIEEARRDEPDDAKRDG